MKKTYSILLLFVTALFFISCGGSSGSETMTTTDIEVERGKVYEANVTDANGNIATQKSGENIYTFNTTPSYPISVRGGWIDIDGDLNKTATDIVLSITLKSYYTVVTPITTYLADTNESVREQRVQELLDETGVGLEELLKVPSRAETEVILTSNALFYFFMENEEIELATLKAKITDLQSYLDTDPTKITSEEIARFLEEKVVSDLFLLTIVDEPIAEDEEVPSNNDSENDGSKADSLDIDTPSEDDNSSSSENSSFNHENYTYIAIYKNISSSFGESLGEDASSEHYFDIAEEGVGCQEFGYTFVEETNGNVNSKSYTLGTRVCNELDYSATSYSGENSYIFAY